MDFANASTTQSLADGMETSSANVSFVIRQFILPIIGFLGLLGNSLAVTIFTRPSMRDNSCSVLLATRSISDNCFILTLFVVWLDFVHIRIVHLNGICQITLFLSYVCSFMSVWCVVFVTIENYIRICNPTKVPIFCTTKIAICSVVIGLCLAIVMYNFPIWTTNIREHNGVIYCMTKENFVQIEHALTYLDTLLTLIIPLIVILIFMTMIILNSFEARRRQNRLQIHRLSIVSDFRRQISPHSKVTTLLFVVTVMFLILHTPSHVIRLKVIIQNIIGDHYATSDTDRLMQQLLLVLYYLNFSINIVIYVLCGRNFRAVLIQTFCFKKCNHSDHENNANDCHDDAKSRNLIENEDSEEGRS